MICIVVWNLSVRTGVVSAAWNSPTVFAPSSARLTYVQAFSATTKYNNQQLHLLNNEYISYDEADIANIRLSDSK